MTTYRWKYLMKLDDGATVFVDSNNRKTKIVKTSYIYVYDGIFPNIDFDTRKRYTK